MASLRTFHMLFLLVVIAGAEVFGAWMIRESVLSGDRLALALGGVSLVGGVGLMAYAWWVTRKLDRAHIQ